MPYGYNTNYGYPTSYKRGGAAGTPAGTNIALASNGGSATATTTVGGSAAKVIDGSRNTNNDWPNQGHDAGVIGCTYTFTFNRSYRIGTINCITLADAVNYSTDPTLNVTGGGAFGIKTFTIDYWDGSAWQNLANVVNNNIAWTQYTFTPVTTDKVRLVVTDAPNGSSRMVEFEVLTA